MDSTTLITLVGTIAATIGGKEAWTYYKKRLDVKAKLKTYGAAGEIELRNEIREILEGQITELKDQVKLLTERILHLEEERDIDKKRIANQEIKITLLSERLVTRTKKSPTNPLDVLSLDDENPLDDIPTID